MLTTIYGSLLIVNIFLKNLFIASGSVFVSEPETQSYFNCASMSTTIFLCRLTIL